MLVVITDGGDTSSKVSYSEAVRAAQTAEAIVYSIIMVPIEASAGRDIGGEHALIQISHDTGGKYYYASNLNGLDKAFKQISEELRTQYLIAYYPAQRIGGDFRKIKRRRGAAGRGKYSRREAAGSASNRILQQQARIAGAARMFTTDRNASCLYNSGHGFPFGSNCSKQSCEPQRQDSASRGDI